MNIVNFWQQQITKWNEEHKCDLCWKFYAPLTESAVNVVKDVDCCVQVFFVRERVTAFSTVNNYNAQTGFVNQTACNKSFQVLFLVPSNVGTMNFNEVEGHPTSESKWDTILSKLEDCLACDLNLDFCEFVGQKWRVTQWQGQQLINYLDNAYTGYRLTVNFQNVY